ncbi:ATP-binding protein [Haloarcula litorea]|uniref:ATP-binding protein n=1 Tax=Haloarcula litorea TaxID=3032579 RepID=UPI0023E768EB|nr:ATP-binding protein [Halomicroarcula sp. GDY20]
MATIQLLVENRRNRSLLTEALSEDHDVVAGVGADEDLSDVEFDLCLLDTAAFRTHRDWLADRKAAVSPVFVPYLLVLGDRDPDRVSEAVWERVDEVIDAPVDPAELRNRVDNLVERRDLSLELNRRKEFTERRFRTLFESTPDPIVVVTDDGTVTEVNESFVGMFDADREDIVGSALGTIEASPDESVERLLLRIDGTGDQFEDGSERTVEIRSRDGDHYVTELNVDVVEELGDVTERIGIFRDVTGRERQQRELERQVEQLEQFASVISHDLRDPLNTAMAKVRLAKRECDSEKLDELQAVHDRMEELIEDVLLLAKQGKATGTTRPFDLAPLVETAWSTVDTPETATLVVGDPPTVEADDERLRALLENLLRNAAEHGGHEVTVEVDALGDRTGFYVADDGPGVPQSERGTVFEYGHTTTDAGTGLGLAIVEQIAEAHGWSVSLVESADGGARFEFETGGLPD